MVSQDEQSLNLIELLGIVMCPWSFSFLWCWMIFLAISSLTKFSMFVSVRKAWYFTRPKKIRLKMQEGFPKNQKYAGCNMGIQGLASLTIVIFQATRRTEVEGGLLLWVKAQNSLQRVHTLHWI